MTRVGLIFVAERINVYLRFGHPVREQIVDRRRRRVEFAPGAVFCRIRWEGGAYGTELWQLSILQASSDASDLQRIRGVTPGAAILLEVSGPAAVHAVLRVIDAIEALKVDPAEVSANYWRMLNNRRLARIDASEFGLDRTTVRAVEERRA